MPLKNFHSYGATQLDLDNKGELYVKVYGYGAYQHTQCMNTEKYKLECIIKNAEADAEERALACIQLSDFYLANEEPSKAKCFSQKTLQLSDKSNTYAIIARVHQTYGNYGIAAEYFLQGTKKADSEPLKNELLDKAAQCYVGAKDYKKAQQLWHQLQQQSPHYTYDYEQHLFALVKLAQIAQKQKAILHTTELFLQCLLELEKIYHNPKSNAHAQSVLDACNFLIPYYEKKQEWTTLCQLYELSDRYAPNANIKLKIAELKFKLNDFAGALTFYKELARGYQANNPPIKQVMAPMAYCEQQLGIQAYKNKDYQLCINYLSQLNKANKLLSEDAIKPLFKAYYKLALKCIESAEYVEMCQYFEQCLQLKIKFSQLQLPNYHNICLYALAKKLVSEAQHHCQKINQSAVRQLVRDYNHLLTGILNNKQEQNRLSNELKAVLPANLNYNSYNGQRIAAAIKKFDSNIHVCLLTNAPNSSQIDRPQVSFFSGSNDKEVQLSQDSQSLVASPFKLK